MVSFDHASLAAAAEVDPWALRNQVASGDPAEIERLASAFYRAGGDTTEAAATQRSALSYQSAGYRTDDKSPLDDSAEVKRTQRLLADAQDKLPKIGKLLAGVGDDLALSIRTTKSDVDALNGKLKTIESSYLTFMQTTGVHLESDDRESAAQGFFTQAISAVRTYGGYVKKSVDGYETSLSTATKSLADLGYFAPDELSEAGEVVTPVLPVGSNPTTVATWWAKLSPAQQEYLRTHDYQTLGRLKGLPAVVLDEANRHRVSDDLAHNQNQLAYYNAHPNADPLGLIRSGLQSKIKDDQGIITEVDSNGPGHPPAPIYVLAYTTGLEGGQTGVAISYGNPDTATNTGVVVPGTGNNAAGLTSTGKNGRDLYTHMTGNKAVVVWLDGPEPQSVKTQSPFDSWANNAAPNLVTDLAGLKAAHQAATGTDGHITAIGHSYGTYILGKAMTEGANKSVDDVAFVGSPGVGVNHASELGISPSHVWDGEAGDDPILWTSRRFTPDPLTGNNPEESEFGAQHFSVSGSHGHSEYYQGESLRNIAAIASGNADGVDRVDAPNYHGLKELPGDVVSTLATPGYTDYHAAKDLVTGHPIDAGKDVVNGTIKQGKNILHEGEDAGSAAVSGVKKVGGWLGDHL